MNEILANTTSFRYLEVDDEYYSDDDGIAHVISLLWTSGLLVVLCVAIPLCYAHSRGTRQNGSHATPETKAAIPKLSDDMILTLQKENFILREEDLEPGTPTLSDDPDETDLSNTGSPIPCDDESSEDSMCIVLPNEYDGSNKSLRNLCAICLSPYQVGESIALASNRRCIHGYHRACIEQVLQRSNKCPICRLDFVVLDDGRSDAEGSKVDDAV